MINKEEYITPILDRNINLFRINNDGNRERSDSLETQLGATGLSHTSIYWSLEMQICDYGCGQPAFHFKPYSKKWCCEKSQNQCPAIKAKQNTKEIIAARQAGVLKKYGVTNVSSLSDIKAKKIETCRSNYGVDNPQQSSIIRDKTIETNVSRYGSSNPRHNPMVVEKGKQTCMTRYGVDNGSKTEESKRIISKRKLSLTVAEKEEVSYKRRQTCLATYGVSNVSQDRDIHASKLKTSRAKTFVFPSGRSVVVQGYEPRVLEDLLRAGIKEHDIVVGEDVPIIEYEFDGKIRRYFPDIYIKSQNWIIEVKSLYTFNLCREQNLKKRVATKNSGYSFSFAIR